MGDSWFGYEGCRGKIVNPEVRFHCGKNSILARTGSNPPKVGVSRKNRYFRVVFDQKWRTNSGQCETVTSYQVVTEVPNGISHPSAFFSARIGSPRGCPEPSRGWAETVFARSSFRNAIRPT